MPLALDPSETVPVSLKIDAAKPDGARPTFLLRFLTCREVLTVERMTKVAFDEKDNAVGLEKLNDVLRVGLTGWRNVIGRDGEPVPFSIEAVDDVLTMGEKWELAYCIASAPRVTLLASATWTSRRRSVRSKCIAAL